MENQTNIIFLHHSTGHIFGKVDFQKFAKKFGFDGM